MWLQTIGSFKPLFSHLLELIEGRSVSHRQCLARRECWIKGKYIKIHNKKLFFLFKIPDTTSLPPKLYFYLCFLIITIKCTIKRSTLSGIKSWPHPWAIMWPWKRYLTSVSQFLLYRLENEDYFGRLNEYLVWKGIGRIVGVCQMWTIIIVAFESESWYSTLWFSVLWENRALYIAVGEKRKSWKLLPWKGETEARKVIWWISAFSGWDTFRPYFTDEEMEGWRVLQSHSRLTITALYWE